MVTHLSLSHLITILRCYKSKNENRKKKGEKNHIFANLHTRALSILGRFCSSLFPFLQFLVSHGTHKSNKKKDFAEIKSIPSRL